MAILSVKYPIIFSPGVADFDYTISLEGAPIYFGHTHGTEVDISPVLQSYMNSDLVTVSVTDLPHVEVNTVVKTFTVTGGTVTKEYLVANDYNDDWIQQCEGDYITSYSVTGKYHPDDLLFVDVNSPEGTAVIESNLGTETGFNSAHVTIKQSGEEDDGIEVDEINNNISSNSNTQTIAYNGIMYVAGSRTTLSGYIHTSTDLKTWTERLYSSIMFTNIKYVNNIFIGAGWYATTGYIYTSTDGITWTSRYSRSGLIINDITWNGSYYIASAANSTIVYSDDAETWTQFRISSENLKFVSISSNGEISIIASDTENSRPYANTDQSNPTFWNTVGQTMNFRAVKTRYLDTAGLFVIVGRPGSQNIAYSSDSTNWNILNINGGVALTDIAYDGINYVVISENGSAYYSDTISNLTWNEIKLSDTLLNSIIYDGEKFVIVGLGNTIYTTKFKETEIGIITVNGEEYPIIYSNGCERYTLYWVNKLGGRSQLLLRAKSQEVIDNSFSRINTNYNRTEPGGFGNRTLQNETTKRWILHTEILTDEQSKKMDDLFTSPKVWLHDHETDQILAVYITDSSVTRKTVKNDRMFSYAIHVTQAQKHLRR